MLSFESDYIEGAHEKLLKKLLDTNMEKLSGYGNDEYSESAKMKIRQECGCPDAGVYFLVGGTQTNRIIISSMLSAYEGVIAANSGHVSVHEAGAIESSGHKVLNVSQNNGKIEADELSKYIKEFYDDENHEHMVFPGMVYISHPTEYGTLYSLSELEAISSVCHSYDIPLYIDGARLGYGLMSYGTDVSLLDIARLSDVFYIGGTKVGALCGEAVVFPHGNEPGHFMTIVKQNGGLLAKGRLLGIQFDELFSDNLYFDISRHAIDMAEKVKRSLAEKGYRFYLDSPTNQIFIILENKRMQELEKSVRLGFWEKTDETHTVVRIATSLATSEEDIRKLIDLL